MESGMPAAAPAFLRFPPSKRRCRFMSKLCLYYAIIAVRSALARQTNPGEDVTPMTDNHLLEVQAILRNNGILITFSGRLSQQLIEEYGEAVKTYLENEDQTKQEIVHTFSIFIEQTQNIKNYCANRTDSPVKDRIAQSSIVTIGKNDKGNFICSGNLVEEADLPQLIARIEEILKLDKDELKKLYKTRLRQSNAEDPSGAGIGLIDMARKASLPLEYSVTPQDGGLSFFTLKAVV